MDKTIADRFDTIKSSNIFIFSIVEDALTFLDINHRLNSKSHDYNLEVDDQHDWKFQISVEKE